MLLESNEEQLCGKCPGQHLEGNFPERLHTPPDIPIGDGSSVSMGKLFNFAM